MRTFDGLSLTPGVNVDKLNIAAGVQEAADIGYDSQQDRMVATYALQRWARGEEDGAFQTFLSHGFDLTSAYRIVSAAATKWKVRWVS